MPGLTVAVSGVESDNNDHPTPLSARSRPTLRVGVAPALGGTPLRTSFVTRGSTFGAGIGYGLPGDPDSPPRKLENQLRASKTHWKGPEFATESKQPNASVSSGGGHHPLVKRTSTRGGDAPLRTSALQARPPPVKNPDLQDPLPEASLRLLSIPPAQRDDAIVLELMKESRKLADEFFGTLSEEHHMKLARAWRYQFFRPGDEVVMHLEATQYLFVVVQGACEVSERQVHHLEGRSGTEGYRRTLIARGGKAFGPRSRSHETSLNKKIRALGLRRFKFVIFGLA